MGTEAPNTEPVVDSSSASPSAETESTIATEPQAPAIPQPEAAPDVMIPSVEADPWAGFDKVPDSTEETDKAPETSEKVEAEPEKKADDAATPEPAKVEEKPKTEEPKKEEETEKSLEDQVLEEAFGDKSPEDAGAKKDPEKLKDEDLDKLDPQEMINAQRNAGAKAWAQRNAKRATIVNDFIHDTRPITEVSEELQKLNPTRFTELSQHAAHQLVDANPEATMQRAYAVAMMKTNPYFQPTPENLPTLQEIIQLKSSGQAPAPAANGVNGHLAPAHFPEAVKTQITALEATLEGHNWRDPAQDDKLLDEREVALVKTLRELEKNLSSASVPTVPEKPEDANGTKPVADPEADIKKAIAGDLDTEISNYRTSLADRVLPWIAKNTGLEISPTDTPEVKDFKKALFLHYEGTPHQKANNLDSDFETFAYTESSVADEINEAYTNVTDLMLQAVIARKQGNEAEAKKQLKEAADARVHIINLFGTANKEFRKLRIDPQLALMGSLSTSLTEKVLEASERVEVVSDGGSAPAQPRTTKDPETAEGVWDSMIEEAAEDDRLRAA